MIAYKNREVEIIQNGVDRKRLANLLQVKYVIINDKITGKNSFAFNKALKIKTEHFQKVNLKTLFYREAE